jgi:hypothetical protein
MGGRLAPPGVLAGGGGDKKGPEPFRAPGLRVELGV